MPNDRLIPKWKPVELLRTTHSKGDNTAVCKYVSFRYIKLSYHRKKSSVFGFANSGRESVVYPFSSDLKLVKTDHPWPNEEAMLYLAGFELLHVGDWVAWVHSYWG